MSIKKQKLGKSGLVVSQIGLGTAELGLAYGIGVRHMPSETETDRILKTAIELGITYIDTARGYGVSEARIGKSGVSRLPGVVVGTKCAQFLEKGVDPRGTELAKLIRGEIEESLRMLKVSSLQLVQIHGGSKEQIERGEIIEIMSKLKDEGKIQHLGIATRGEAAPLAAIATGFFETIQTAYSILDQRMAPRVLPKAHVSSVGIINRSVLLKGALTKVAEKLPAKLRALKENAKLASLLAAEIGIDLPTLAIRFVLSNKAITTALIGTVTPNHLTSAIAALEDGPLPNEVLEKLSPLAISDPRQVDPANWPVI